MQRSILSPLTRRFATPSPFGRGCQCFTDFIFARASDTEVLLRSAAAQGTWGASAPAEFEILGVVENERFRGLELPSEPAVYLSTRQFAQTGFTLLISTANTIRGASEPRVVVRELRAWVRAIEPAATIDSPVLLTDILAEQLVARRVTADVIGGFAGSALALAALGVYGVLSMLVASRTREIGVRLALGASPSRMAVGVVRESVLNTAPGLVAGVGLAIAAGRFLESFLVGVTGRDPVTLSLVSGTMLGVALLAALIPALRAARVDPVVALRAE